MTDNNNNRSTHSLKEDGLRDDIEYVKSTRVSCDGMPVGSNLDPEFGHPKVYYSLSKGGVAKCSYCGRQFVYSEND